MNDQMKKRLEELRLELQSGQQVLSELEVKKADTTHTLLRISGAIQVLEELLENEKTNIQEIPSSEAKTA